MSQQIPILTISLVAVAAVPQQRFVGIDRQVCGAGAPAWGVADSEASAAGKVMPVKVLGTSKVETGGAVTPGQLVKSDAVGRAVPQGGAGAILARAITGAAALGGMIEVLLLPSNA